MSTPIKTVAIAGASGSLGVPITKALLAANFTVTALTRADSKSTFPPGVKVLPVDYSSPDSLQTALKGQDALISTLAGAAGSEQNTLISAAVAAGVRRILPSEFGSDTSNPRARSLPVYKPKIETEELLKRLCEESGGRSTYTLVYNNAFLDWGIAQNFLINAQAKTFDLVDGGDGYFTSTPLSLVAEGVVAILSRPEETANRGVHLQGARMTQRKFLAIVQRVTGGEQGWTIKEVDSKEVERQAYEVLKADPSNVPGWLFPMLGLAVYAKEFGGDFGEVGARETEGLGLKGLTEEEVEEVVRASVVL